MFENLLNNNGGGEGGDIRGVNDTTSNRRDDTIRSGSGYHMDRQIYCIKTPVRDFTSRLVGVLYKSCWKSKFFFKLGLVTILFCTHSFGRFPGVWILRTEVSVHSVSSIFIGCVSRKKSRITIRNLTLLLYRGIYVTPVLFESHFVLNCHEYWHRLLRIIS